MYLVTLVAVVSTNLLEGVLIGFACSLLRLLYSLAKLKLVAHYEKETQETHLHLSGIATFINLPSLAHALEQLPLDGRVCIHLAQVHYMDQACIELLEGLEKRYESAPGELMIRWVDLSLKKTKSVEGHSFAHSVQALEEKCDVVK